MCARRDAHARHRPAFADGAPADDDFAHGLELQQAKQYSYALEVFRKAYRTKPTPQSLLHFAECEIALGHLVKAEDHLHALVDATIPEDSPPEFFAAQAQGKVELAELSPRVRVGRLTVRVAPPKVEGLLVTLDGLALNEAQLGSAQRVEAGSHVVVVTVTNYLPDTTTVTVPEGQAVDAQVGLGESAPAVWGRSGTAITVLGGIAAVVSSGYIAGASFACS